MATNRENIICDTDNYKENYDYSKCFQYNKYYVKLISHYLEYLCDHTTVKNNEYFIFILNRGISSLGHIFNMLFLYTKNIDLTISHCNKALYYYIEFIGQISEDTHSYLQLNSKDAALFIYKKTIFELNNDYRKQYTLIGDDKDFFETISKLNSICNELIQIILHKKGFDIQKKEIGVNYIIAKISKVMNQFKLYSFNEFKKKVPLASFFIHLLYISEVDVDKLLLIYEIFIKKLRKKNITKNNIQQKLYQPLHRIYISNLSPNKYINWILS